MKYFLLPLLFCAQQVCAQPVLLNDIYPGAASSNPVGMYDYYGSLLFAATDGQTGYELWHANGTNVSMVDDLYPMGGSSVGTGSVNQKCTLNGEVYFAADEDGTGTDLYKWDGTNKPVKVFDISGSSSGLMPSYLCALNGKVYFFGLDDFLQWHLYMYNPMNGNVNMVGAIDPNYYQDGFGSNMTVINDELYFSAMYAETPGVYTMQVFKYNPVNGMLNRSGTLPSGVYPSSFKFMNGNVYFISQDNNSANRLWSWDGMHQPTMVNELIYQYGIEVYNGKIYGNAGFSQSGPFGVFGYEPFSGTNKGIGVSGILSSKLVPYADKLFFCAGDKLWSYDGVQTASQTLSTTYTGREMAVAGNTLYMTGNTQLFGEELYAYYEAPTTVKSVTQADGITIHPNPSTGSWNFELSNMGNETLQLIVTDVMGKVVSKQTIVNKKATATAPTAGSYIYYIANAKGEALIKGKLQRL